MIQFLVLFYTLQGLLPQSSHVSAQSVSVDDYCFSQMPASKKTLRTGVGILHLIRVCSDIDKYSYCIIKNRQVPNDMYYTIKPYQAKFPSEYDMRRAGFLFCSDFLPKNVDGFIVDEEVLMRCEAQMKFVECINQFWSADMDAKGNQALQSGDARLIEDVSCNISYGLLKCLRDKYILCDKKYANFFVYDMAALGPDCLLKHGEYSPLVHVKVCNKRSASTSQESEGSQLVTNSRLITALVALSALTFGTHSSFFL